MIIQLRFTLSDIITNKIKHIVSKMIRETVLRSKFKAFITTSLQLKMTMHDKLFDKLL